MQAIFVRQKSYLSSYLNAPYTTCMEAPKKSAGRPKKPPEEQTVSWTLRVPPPVKAKGQKLGVALVSAAIMKAKLPAEKS